MNNERLKNERNKLNSQLKRKDEIIKKLKEEKVKWEVGIQYSYYFDNLH